MVWHKIKIIYISISHRVVALQRYVYSPDPDYIGMPAFVIKYFGRVLKKRAIAQGYGLHSQEESM